MRCPTSKIFLDFATVDDAAGIKCIRRDHPHRDVTLPAGDLGTTQRRQRLFQTVEELDACPAHQPPADSNCHHI